MQTRADSGISRIEVAIIAVIVGIIMAVALPGLWRARMASNEAAAIASLRRIVSAEMAYASVCGGNRYADSLQTLGTPPPGGSQPFLPPELTGSAPESGGFRFGLARGEGAEAAATDCHGRPAYTGYYASAVPVRFGRTGARSFAVNTAGTVWQDVTAAAPEEPFGAPASPVR
jgi:type II secretory pathway pseudopilin PulG